MTHIGNDILHHLNDVMIYRDKIMNHLRPVVLIVMIGGLVGGMLRLAAKRDFMHHFRGVVNYFLEIINQLSPIAMRVGIAGAGGGFLIIALTRTRPIRAWKCVCHRDSFLLPKHG